MQQARAIYGPFGSSQTGRRQPYSGGHDKGLLGIQERFTLAKGVLGATPVMKDRLCYLFVDLAVSDKVRRGYEVINGIMKQDQVG